jgi:hypothetical protein
LKGELIRLFFQLLEIKHQSQEPWWVTARYAKD